MNIENAGGRAASIAQAFRLEYLSAAWIALEAVVAIQAAAAAGSLSLLAFGLDSVIELASALVLIWRLRAEWRHGAVFAESHERLAARVAGVLLLALAAFVVAASAWSLWVGRGEADSASGLAVTVLAIPVMLELGRRKRVLAEQLGSRALRADAAESLGCAWLSGAVVVGLVAHRLTGWWWVDSATALAVVWFLVREGREALAGEACCDGD